MTIIIYTIKTLARRRKQFLGALLSVALCVALVLTVLSVAFSVEESLNNHLVRKYGTYSSIVEVKHTGPGTEANTAIAGRLLRVGTVECEKSIYDNQLTLGAISLNASAIMPIRLASGNLPQNSGEVAIEQSVGEKLQIPISPGTVIALDISCFSGGKIHVELTISGIIENYASYCDYGDSEVFLPSLLVSEEQAHMLGGCKEYEIFKDFTGSSADFTATDTNIYINPRFDENSAVSLVDTSTSVMLLIASVCAILVAGICLLAYFFLVKAELLEHIQNLKLIGAGQAQLLLFAILRALIVFVLSFVLGMILGACAFYGSSEMLFEQMIDTYDARVSSFAILCTGLAVFFCILSIHIFYLLRIWKKRPLEKKGTESTIRSYPEASNNVLTKWMLLSMRNRRKTYICIVLAMSVCYLAVVIGTMFQSTITAEYDKVNYEDYSVTAQNGGFVSFFNIPLSPYYGVSDLTIDELITSGEASQISYIKQLNVVIEDKDRNERLHEYYGSSIREESEQVGGDFEQLVKDFSIDPESDYYKVRIVETDDHLLSALLKQECVQGDANIDTLKDGKHIIVVCPDIQTCPYLPGDKIFIFQALPQTDMHFSPHNCDIFRSEVTVAAVIQIDERNSDIGNKFYSNPAFKFVWGEGSFSAHNVLLNSQKIYIYLNDFEKHEKVDAIIEQIKYALPDAKISSRLESEEEKQLLLGTMSCSISSLVIFIGATSILMYISITQKKYIGQTPLWGALRAIGIQKRTVIAYHTLETVFVFGASMVVNLMIIGAMRLLPLRRDVQLLSPTLLIAYIVFMLIAYLGTLPTVCALFSVKINQQLEHVN